MIKKTLQLLVAAFLIAPTPAHAAAANQDPQDRLAWWPFTGRSW